VAQYQSGESVPSTRKKTVRMLVVFPINKLDPETFQEIAGEE